MPNLPSHVWKLTGPVPGPTVAVIGGTHGDELTGIAVVDALLGRLGLGRAPAGTHPCPRVRGTLFLLQGNPEAIRLRQRGASGVRDLNRCFIAEDLERTARPDDIPDLVRARDLAPLLAAANFVIDLHATSNDSPPFVCFGTDSEEHRRLYRHFNAKYVLTDPDDVLAREEGRPGRGTTDDYVERHGNGIAVTYETGKEDDLGRVEDVTREMLGLLDDIGSIEDPGQVSAPSPDHAAPPVYALAHSIQAASAPFAYAPGMDAGWQTVTAGQLVGTYADGTEERVPEDGMLVFPKGATKVVAGKNLYFLAVPKRA